MKALSWVLIVLAAVTGSFSLIFVVIEPSAWTAAENAACAILNAYFIQLNWEMARSLKRGEA